MKNYIIVVFFLLYINANAQMFKGLEYGMSRREAKKEFRKNTSEYDNVDFGNGFVWRLYTQNFLYEDNNLVGVWFTPKGGALGLTHKGATSYLEFTRVFFEDKNYTVFFEPEYWQYPINFNSMYGLLMHDSEKNIIVHLYPYQNGNTYNAYMKVFNYEWFMNVFDDYLKGLEQKSENSGF
ncbi:MAG: hypothetical protein R6U85_10275 [Salinivirgaceae bacterium]